MEGFWWLLLIVLFLLFGKNFFGSGIAPFTLGQAIPGPQSLPAMTTQNQTDNNPVAQPAPWSNTCALVAVPPTSVGIGVNGGAGLGGIPVNFPGSAPPPASNIRRRVTFTAA